MKLYNPGTRDVCDPKRILLAILLLGSLCLWAQQPPLPITEYDYTLPGNNVSPVTMGMGGMNVTSMADAYASYNNPALLAGSEVTSFATSFRLAANDELGFWQAMQISNALREKQFQYFSVTTKQVGFAYQPVANVHLSEWSAVGDTSRYYDYKLDKVLMSLAAKDTKYTTLQAGLSIKYLSGRLVYLREHRVGNSLVRDAFIDDKVKGFSTDLGFTYKPGNMVIGATIYDLFSRLYWENYDSKPIQRRIGMGMEYDNNNLKLLLGLQSKISKDPDTSYHLGLQYSWNWNSESFIDEQSTEQGMVIRTGMYSSDFYGTKNINYTLGTGYNYNLLRFDVSMSNQGMELKNSKYLFSIGVGFK